MNKTLHKASRMRQQLRKLIEEIEGLVDVFSGHKPFIKGSVYKMKSKCGKPNCACVKGALHERWVLSFSSEGRTHIRSIPGKKLNLFKEAAYRYQNFRRSRASLVQIHKKMLEFIDGLDVIQRKEL